MLRKYSNTIIINLTVLLTGLIIIELVFGTWLYRSSNFNNLLIPKQQTNIMESLPYASNNIAIYSRDKNGFRANNYSLNEIEILILGGSTTEEREIDDKLIWTKVFEKKINKNYQVLNAGIGGQTSYGHKNLYRLWFSRFKELKPKFMIVYLGINDALFLVENMEKQHDFSKGRIINDSNRDLIKNEKFFSNTIQYIKNNSALHSLYLVIKGNILSRKYRINYKNKPKYFDAYFTKSPSKDIVLDSYYLNNFYNYYKKNIIDIIEINKIYDSTLILSTQKISNKHWLNPYLEIVNSFTLKICKEKNLICFNLHDNINFIDQIDFYDGIHTSPSGSLKIGESLALFFNKEL